jgi:hypothetical protein
MARPLPAPPRRRVEKRDETSGVFHHVVERRRQVAGRTDSTRERGQAAQLARIGDVSMGVCALRSSSAEGKQGGEAVGERRCADGNRGESE